MDAKYKVDGFRFDFTKGIGNNYKSSSDAWGSLYDKERINLLKQIADNVWSNNSNGIVIMEHLAEDREDRELADYGILLWANANFNFSEASWDIMAEITLPCHGHISKIEVGVQRIW